MNPAVLAIVIGALAAAAAGATRPRRAPRGRARGPVFPTQAQPVAAALLELKDRPALRYLYKRSATHKHRGIDIFAPEGSPVLAPFAGVVMHTNSAWFPGFGGYGQTVVLRITEATGRVLYLLFAHLSRVDVREGQRVSAGQQLGLVGRTSYPNTNRTRLFVRSNAHLHFEAAEHPYPMAPEAHRIDPLPVLGLA